MHGQGKNSSFFQYSYYLRAKLQRNNDTTKYYRLFFIVPLPLAPCSSPHAPRSFLPPPSGGVGEGVACKDISSLFFNVPFCVSKAMLLRAKRYAFGVQKVTF